MALGSQRMNRSYISSTMEPIFLERTACRMASLCGPRQSQRLPDLLLWQMGRSLLEPDTTPIPILATAVFQHLHSKRITLQLGSLRGRSLATPTQSAPRQIANG